ncbi:hypothetical protein M9Y10_034095 [Tritrichomonas musculus]|uniref:Uncharacterized protein n=1 Tax=Tritrichomonas musculus TaxID=1915356 RepID=A0ABR2KDZ7_9EUKA
MDAAKLMAILSSANERGNKDTLENQKLRNVLNAQQQIIRDLSLSFNTEELLEKVENSRQMEENLNGSLASSTSFLKSLLFTPPKKDPQVSNIIKSILSDIQGQLTTLCKQCVDQKMTSVPITALVDIEQQMNSFEDKLAENGQFPEKEEDKNRRMLLRDFHTQNVLNFLSDTLHKKSDSESDSERDSNNANQKE